MKGVVVIGAGVGGLTTAAILARQGVDVTVLEAHVYPGGCAGTFPHRGYAFDAGATLAGGFYPGGPMDQVAQAAGIDAWPLSRAPAGSAGAGTETVMAVHLPGGRVVRRLAGSVHDTVGAAAEAQQQEYRAAFGVQAQAFWAWQERRARAMWDLAQRLPDWPVQSPSQAGRMLNSGWGWLGEARRYLGPGEWAGLLADAFRPVAAHLQGQSDRLRLFVDGQLLISAQADSRSANALYGAAALDLPRRGVVHLAGGMGAIAGRLVQAVRQNGGQVHFRQGATRIVMENGHPAAVKTRRGGSFPAGLVVANLPPWNLARLLGDSAPGRLRRLPVQPSPGWGAFVVYLGIDAAILPPDFPLHHQVLCGEGLGEGRSVFLSISPGWDASRAPQGRRAVTISTHTRLGPWWERYAGDRAAYEAVRQDYAGRLIAAAEVALPGLRQAAELILPGTPVTFERFTRRAAGWVGGFPQTNLFQSWGPRQAPGVWMVGDSIFPGQSTAAAALGGLRVARDVGEMAF